MAKRTTAAYQRDLLRFLDWGGQIPATPESLATYLSAHAESHKTSTMIRWMVSVSKAHTTQGMVDPTKTELVKIVIKGIRRTHGSQQRQVTPAIREDIISMVKNAAGAGPKETRDRALLLLGFAGAFRRSELVALNVEDIQEVREGLTITLQRSKTDQEGCGRKIGIPFARGAHCPVKAIQSWIQVAGIIEGPIFRGVDRHGNVGERLSNHAVARIIKAWAEKAGLDPVDYAGHSLRSGLVTSAANAGIANHKIRAQTGHKGDTMLNRYIRDGQMFVDNAAGIL
ncbi:MAG: site-specific integrase [Magnetococcales bacterium]|nr:site-specific integrase [Magnetococcales bacterium]